MKTFSYRLVALRKSSFRVDSILRREVEAEELPAARTAAEADAKSHQRSLGDGARVAYLDLVCEDPEGPEAEPAAEIAP